jgi:putative NADH-flavin reductase
MTRIAVFGAGGRAGRRVIEESLFRGHEVTAVVRDKQKYAELERPGVQLALGDVTDPDQIADAVRGHDAVIVAVYLRDVDASAYYSAVAKALIEGLGAAGVRRLVVLGIGTLLESSPGVRFMDQPEFPPDYLPFNDGRVLELEILDGSPEELDWVVVCAPPSPLDNVTPRTGRYRVTGRALAPYDNGDGPRFQFPYNAKGPLFTFTDLAVALVDEADSPRHHRDLVGIAP